MTVPFFDMAAGLEEFRSELDDAWRRVVDRGHLILGRELEAFEAEFAAYSEVAHCVGVGNGLDALMLTLRALDVRPGDEVIVPSHTFIATWLAVSTLGAKPVPVEPRRETMLVDPDAIEAAITPRTRGIIPVHLYGQPAAMDAIGQIAQRNGLFVLEDAAQAHGARYRGHRIGGLTSTAAAFSFYPAKNLGSLGDGGAVVTDDAALAERIRLLRNYGSPRKYDHPIAGINSRLDELQAALLRVKLRHLDAANERRRRLAALYTERLAGISGIVTPTIAAETEPVWHLYVIRVEEERDALADHLREQGIQTLIHYPCPCHLQAAYASLGLGPGALPVAERLAQTVLSLPLWPQMPEEMLNDVARAIRQWAGAPASAA